MDRSNSPDEIILAATCTERLVMLVTPSTLRNLGQKEYEKRKHAALEVESLVRERPISIEFETPGQELIQDGATGEIRGIWAARKDGERLAIKARKGVILTCGGFENNQEIVQDYCAPPVNTRSTYVVQDADAMTAAVRLKIFPEIRPPFVGATIVQEPASEDE